MSTNTHKTENASDLSNIIAAIVMSLIAIGLLTLYLWSENEQLIKNIALGGAYHLRWVQLPFTWLMSDGYSSVLYNLPNVYNNLYGVSYDSSLVKPLLNIFMRSLAILTACIVIPRAIYLIKNHDKINFSRKLDIHGLIEIMREQYPRIKPATAQNLLKMDARFGRWASQLNAFELVTHQGLVDTEDDQDVEDEEKQKDLLEAKEDLRTAGLKPIEECVKDVQGMTTKTYDGPDGHPITFPTGEPNKKTETLGNLFDHIDHYHGTVKINKKGLEKYFAESLGPLCYGQTMPGADKSQRLYVDIRYLPPIERAFWVICMACIAQDSQMRVRVEKMLDQMSDTFVEDQEGDDHQMDLTGIDDLYHDAIQFKRVKIALTKVARQHGYYYTAFTRLYEMAKESYGTISSTNDFRWLGIVNRILYLSINQIGLDRARFETAGVRSHYLAERHRKNGRGARISKPQIESAVINTISAIDEEEWTAVKSTMIDEDEESSTFMRAIWLNKTT